MAKAVFSVEGARKIARFVRDSERDGPHKGRRRAGRAPGPDVMRFGKATAAWTSGNTVTLTPCMGPVDATVTGEANRTIYLYLPTTYTPVGVLIAQNDILGYWPFMEGESVKGVLASVPLDTDSCPA